MEPNMDMFSSAAENRSLEDELPPPATACIRRNRNIQGSVQPPGQLGSFPTGAFSSTPQPCGVQDTLNPNIGGAGSSQLLHEHLTDGNNFQIHKFPSGDLQGGPDYDHGFQSQHLGLYSCQQTSAQVLPEIVLPQEPSFTFAELLSDADTQQQIPVGGRGQQQLASDPLAEETPAKNRKRRRSSTCDEATGQLSKDQLFRLRQRMKEQQKEQELQRLTVEDIKNQCTIGHLKEEKNHINELWESTRRDLVQAREDLAVWKNKHEDQEKQIEALSLNLEKKKEELKKLREEEMKKDRTIGQLKEEIASINAEKAHNESHESAQCSIEQQLENLTCQFEKNNVELLEKIHSILLHVVKEKNEQEELNKLRGQSREKDQVIELKENYADLGKADICELLESSKSDLDYVMDKLTLFKKEDAQQQVESRLHRLRWSEMWEIEWKMKKVRGATEEVTEQQRNITEVRLKSLRLKSLRLKSYCRQLREETDAILNSQAIEAGSRKPRQVADLLLFSKKLSRTDIRKRFRTPPSVHPHFDLDLRVKDTSGHVWIFKLTKGAAGRPYPFFSDGWLQFVEDKELHGGDCLDFYRICNYDPGAEYRIEVRRWVRLFGEDSLEIVA